MANLLQKPTDPYDPAWVEYARQNPGLRRSLSAADAGDGGDGGDGGDAIDLSTFVPEQFKDKDGSFKTADFRADYDALSSFKAQADEAAAALPKEAKDYAFAIPEGHQFPEGFDAELFKTVDENGNEVAFDPNAMIQADDPDLPLLQAAMHEHKADPALMGKIASILANRELRGVMDGMAKAEEEKGKLGTPAQAKARFDTIQRSLSAKLPANQVKEIMDGVVSADGLRGLEALLKTSTPPVSQGDTMKDFSDMKPIDRLMAGLSGRK